jgi:ankyrin repeat protein
MDPKDQVARMRAAISERDRAGVLALLEQGCSANLNLGGAFADPLIHMAAANLDGAICEILLAHGADPNARYGTISAPLFSAANHFGAPEDRVTVCEILLRHGAAPNLLLNELGRTPLHMALDNCSPGDVRPLVRLLIAYGGDVHFVPSMPPSWYLTPFQEQVKNGSLENLRFLLEECGADPMQKTVAGRSMLQLAQAGSDAQIRKKIIREAQICWRSTQNEKALPMAAEAVTDHGAAVRPRSPSMGAL